MVDDSRHWLCHLVSCIRLPVGLIHKLFRNFVTRWLISDEIIHLYRSLFYFHNSRITTWQICNKIVEKLLTLSECLDSHFSLTFFLACMNSNCIVYAHGFTVQETKCTVYALFTSLIAPFTHLKIILLKCFQFLVFSKISCIQKDPRSTLFILFIFRYFIYTINNKILYLVFKILRTKIPSHKFLNSIF